MALRQVEGNEGFPQLIKLFIQRGKLLFDLCIGVNLLLLIERGGGFAGMRCQFHFNEMHFMAQFVNFGPDVGKALPEIIHFLPERGFLLFAIPQLKGFVKYPQHIDVKIQLGNP